MFCNTPSKFAVLALAAGLAVPMTSKLSAEDRPALTPANASPNNGANTGESSQTADREFVMKAAAGNMLEVKVGQLAQQKSTATDVKQFGQHMVDDHGKALTELKQLAESKKVPLSTDLTGDEKKRFEKMSALSGDDFDKAYIADMVKDHKEDITDFQKEANDGKDADTKAWAAKMLPTLQSHQQMIQQIAQSHSVDGGARTASEKMPADKGINSNAPGTTPVNQGNVGTQIQQPGTNTGSGTAAQPGTPNSQK